MDVVDLLGPRWPVGEATGFAPRPQQQQMAAAVAAILQEGGTLIVEAGTGTGKTYRLSASRAAVWSAGHHFHRHSSFAGSALSARFAGGAPGAEKLR
jgi:predicted heme/steroid binding protein